MKKLIAVILILALLLPAAALAADPIMGAWYIMLDYSAYPADSGGKSLLLYVLLFDNQGKVFATTTEIMMDNTVNSLGDCVGEWSNNDGVYTVSLIGIGTSNPTIEDDRLIIKMYENIHYSMRKLDFGSWYTDLVMR